MVDFTLTDEQKALRARAVKQGDTYVLNGSKCFITNGGYADWFTVYAKTDPEAGHRGTPLAPGDLELGRAPSRSSCPTLLPRHIESRVVRGPRRMTVPLPVVAAYPDA